MDISAILTVSQTAFELGLIYGLTVLALFLSYSMLGVCDLSTDGCFTLGASVGAVVAISANPYVSIPAAIAAGMLSGLVLSILQTKLGIDSLLSGIIVNTGLYSINIAIMGGKSAENLYKTETVFTKVKALLENTPISGAYKLVVALAAVALVALFLVLFLRTRLGLSIRATGNNPDMVRSSSINTAFTTTVALCISGGITALSGCLMAQQQKSVDINIGTGVVTVALASLLIGGAILGRGRILVRICGVLLGSVIFRLVYTVALRMEVPAFMLKLISAIIVIFAIAGPYIAKQAPLYKRILTSRTHKKSSHGEGGKNA